jgi:shikimate kinase
MKPRLYFIAGISGSGKTTVGRRIEQLGEVAFDSKIQKGLFHFADKAGKQPDYYKPNHSDWMEKYHWVLNKPMLDNLMEQNKAAKRVFLCGGADDLMQYWPLGAKVFLLKVDGETMLKRLREEKRDNSFGKDKQTQDRLLERLDRYQDKMVRFGAIPIDAKKSVDEIVQNILEQSR